MAKRGQGEGTISKRPDGTWWARISLGYDNNGKRKRKAFYGKTRKEVQEKLTEALNDLNKNAYIEPSNMTVAQWMDIWLTEYKKNSLKPSTYCHYRIFAEKYIVDNIGSIKLKDLRNDIVQKFINNLYEGGLSPKSIDRIMQVLKTALKQAVDNELIYKNVALKTILPKSEKPKIRVLTQEEQGVLVEEARKEIHGEVIIFLLATGMRVGEALALNWNDIDFEKNRIEINKTSSYYRDPDDRNSKYKTKYGEPKTPSSIRTIPILPSAVDLLYSLQEKYKSYNIDIKDNYVFLNVLNAGHFGTPLTKAAVWIICKRITERANIKGFRPHCLRHTFATRCLESGIELRVVQEVLGHSNISMTANTYTHVLENKIDESVLKLSNNMNF